MQLITFDVAQNGNYVSNAELINTINKKQTSWTAQAYSWMEGVS